MDRIEWIRRKILVPLLWFALMTTFIVSLHAKASAEEVGDINTSSIQLSPVQSPPKTKQSVDPLAIAIIGLSLGCMLVVSSVHWNTTKRKELETQIQGLDSFLASARSVECHIVGCDDNDPMVRSVTDIRNSRDKKLAEYEEHKNVMNRSVSDIETEILRILG